ncbi:MAG: hypothetical protein HZA95_03545 [Candidatus Vogelbacteria bacterium]|nr:hypothetical protein [Candidatus Vogelbacteria bacterium]
MTYKSLIIIVLIFLSIGAGAGWYFFRPAAPAPDGAAGDAVSDTGYFPSTGNSSGDSSGKGSGGATIIKPSDQADGGDNLNANVNVNVPVMRQLVSSPVSGATILTHGSSTYVRYIEQNTGHMSEIAATEKVSNKITNTTIPKTYKIFWGPKGTAVVAKMFGDEGRMNILFATTTIPLKATTTEETYRTFTPDFGSSIGTLDGLLLPSIIKSIAVSPDSNKLFFLLKTESGTVGVISNFKDAVSAKAQIPIFQSRLSEWLSDWPGSDIILLNSRPSSGITGLTYLLNAKTKRTEKILEGMGLTAKASPDTKKVIFATGEGSGLKTFLYNINTNKKLAFPLQTLPEKCTFSFDSRYAYCGVPAQLPLGEYPDDWYKGKIQFNDAIWKVDLDNLISTVISPTNTSRTSRIIDAIELKTDQTGDLLIFKNKIDDTLWALTLETGR